MKHTYFACLFLCLTTSFAVRLAQAQTETVLYNFKGGSDGFTPESRLTSDGAGNLYGTTCFGGLGSGTVFELSPNGSGGWKETVLYSFTGGADDANPMNGLIMDTVGNLYGRTYVSGGGNGTIFELSKSGGGWTKQVIYDGVPGYAGLTMDASGNIFGVASNGGTIDMAVALSPNRQGGWNPTVIHTVVGGT